MRLILLLAGFVFAANPCITRFLPLKNDFNTAISNQWPSVDKNIIAGQICHESGWKSKAELKNSREHGRGLSQTTIAYNKDGTERFNVYKSLALKSPAFKGFEQRPFDVRLNIEAMIFTNHVNYNMITFVKDDTSRYAAMLIGYNAGSARPRSDYNLCLKEKGQCKVWFNDIELHSKISRKIIPQYKRSAFDISRKYPRDVFEYAKHFKKYTK